MKSVVLVFALILFTTSAFAAEISCVVDVYGKDSQKIAKLHQSVGFAKAAASEAFEYSEIIKVLPNLKVACGRKTDNTMVSCSFVGKNDKSLSTGSTDGMVVGVSSTFEDQQASIAAGYSNTIVSCKLFN